MSAPKPDGGSAFPTEPADWKGMTLRDYFAGQALAGIMASPHTTTSVDTPATQLASLIAKVAYIQADAMIAERSR